MNSLRGALLAWVCWMIGAPALAQAPQIGGWQEAVLSVSDPEVWVRTLTDVGGWEVMERGEGNAAWLQIWQLPDTTRHQEVLMRNPGTDSGYIRLVAFQGVPQVQIRSNGQTWETGGIFDLNVRVTDIDARFVELQARLESARVQLGYTEIHAPFAARIASVDGEEGQFVT